MPKRRDTINYVESTYVFGEDEVALEVPVRVLALADAVCEGAVGLVPVHAHVARRVVDQVVHVVPQLPRPRTTRCFNGEFLEALHLLCYVIHFRYCNARWKKREKKQNVKGKNVQEKVKLIEPKREPRSAHVTYSCPPQYSEYFAMNTEYQVQAGEYETATTEALIEGQT